MQSYRGRKFSSPIEATESRIYKRVMHMKDIIVLLIAILLTAIAMIGMGSADDQEHESAYVGPYELHFYTNNHLEFNVEDKSSGGIGRYKVTGYSVGDPDGAKFQVGILNDPTKKVISQTRQQQIDKMMSLIDKVSGYVVEVDDTVFLDDNHQAQIIRCTLDGTLAHEYIGIMLSGTEEVLMDAPGPMETGLYDYDYAAVLENIQIIGHGIAKFDGENTKPGTLSDATSWSPGIYPDDGSHSSTAKQPELVLPGTTWNFEESHQWYGKWVVREDGKTIDASWTTGYTDIIDIVSIVGDKITLHRHDTKAMGQENNYYTGTISPDGMSMSGTASWYGPKDEWTATRMT